jgi:biotin transporter BioY
MFGEYSFLRSMMPRSSTDVLIDRIPGARNIATDAAWVIAFSLVTAACAQFSFHLPFSPVPITGQTFAVLLSGAVLGWRRAFMSQLVYLAEGAAGLPVFADGAGSVLHLVGPSGGFLLCFPLAAALVGYLVEQESCGSLMWRGSKELSAISFQLSALSHQFSVISQDHGNQIGRPY